MDGISKGDGGQVVVFLDHWVDVERVGPPMGTLPHVAMLFLVTHGKDKDPGYEIAFGRYSEVNSQFQVWTGEQHQVAFPRYYPELK